MCRGKFAVSSDMLMGNFEQLLNIYGTVTEYQ